MKKIKISAPAKINLTLDVIRKREDGYHDLQMIMQTVSLCDEIELNRTDSGITLKTNKYFLPVNAKNLAFRAAEVFFEKAGIHAGVNIYIEKKIPVSAGLAGGSSDCAAVLRAMNVLFDKPFSFDELFEISKTLGSDVPYCMRGGAMLAEGTGDILTPLPPMPGCFILLAKPPVSISTAQIFKRLNLPEIKMRPDTDGTISALSKNDCSGVAVRLFNVLEPVTIQISKSIEQYKKIMLHAGSPGAVMSGSGPTVFGIFENAASAYKARDILSAHTKEVFLVTPIENPEMIEYK